MRILIIGLGGVTRVFRNWPERTLGQALVQAGHEVHAITYWQPQQPHLGLDTRFEVIDGIKVHRVKPQFVPAAGLLQVLRTIPRPDIVHLMHPRNVLAYQATRWLRSHGVPMVWTWLGPYHDRWLIDNRERPYEETPHPERLIFTIPELARRIRQNPRDARELLRNYGIHQPMRLADAFLPCSQHEADELRDELGYGTQVLPVEPLWLDMDFMWSDVAPLDHAFTRPIIPYIGQLTIRKCYDMVVEAMPSVVARFPQASFVFVTHNSEQRANLQQMAQERGVANNLHFLGTVSEEQKLALLRASDVLPFPSRYEGFGLPLLEGMAAGTPVISTNIPVVNEIVRDGENGLLVPYDDSDALGQAITRVMEDRELRAWLVENGHRTIAEHYDPAVLAGRVVDLYRQVMHNDKRQASATAGA